MMDGATQRPLATQLHESTRRERGEVPRPNILKSRRWMGTRKPLDEPRKAVGRGKWEVGTNIGDKATKVHLSRRRRPTPVV